MNAFKVNKITVDAITMRNSDFIEEAIRVLKPKTVHCSLADEELVLPYEPELWSLLVCSFKVWFFKDSYRKEFHLIIATLLI